MENDGYLLESQREVENTFERRILIYSYPFQAFVYCTPHYWRIAKSLCLNYCCAKKLTTSYMNPFIMAAVLSPEVSSLCLNLNQHNFHLVVLNPTFGTAENRSNHAYALSVQYLKVATHFSHTFSLFCTQQS